MSSSERVNVAKSLPMQPETFLRSLSQTDLKFLESVLVGIGGSLGMAVLVYDSNDRLLYANPQVMDFVNVPEACLKPGTDLRTLLAHSWESRRMAATSVANRSTYLDQDAWVEERMAIHHLDWYDQVERLGPNRWIRFISRRTLSGICISLVLDVSETKRQEQQWHSDMERVRLTEEILDSLPFPLFVKNRNLVYIAVNKAFCEIHGVEAESILGRTAFDLLDPDIAEQIEIEDRLVFESGQNSETVETLNTRKQRTMQTITRKHRIGTPGNHMLVTTLDDVTKLADLDIVRLKPNSDETPDLYPLKVTRNAQLPPSDRQDVSVKQVRVLVFLDDASTADQLVAALSAHPFDICAVSTIAELKAFVEMADSLEIEISYCICDRYSWTESKGFLERFNVQPVVITDPTAHVEILQQLHAHVHARVKAHPEVSDTAHPRRQVTMHEFAA